jgi:methylmalonyl-CoA/ethylmalonyl-CoA epimerase
MIEYTFFGNEARFHHVGLGVKSIKAISPESDVQVEHTQGVSLAFVLLNGIRVELLEPYGENSPILASLNNGPKLLHLCYEVPDLDRAITLCRPEGFHLIRKPVPAPVIGHRRVAWVFSKQYGLFELIESEPHTGRAVSQGVTAHT